LGMFKNNLKLGLFNKIDFVCVIILFVAVSELHELGHIAATIIVGGKIMSINWISFTPRIDFSVTNLAEARTVFFMGGYTAAISLSYIFLALNKYLERDKRFLLKSILLSLIIWQLTLGSLEGYNYELYVQLAEKYALNASTVLFAVPALFVFIVYFMKKTFLKKVNKED